MEVYVQKDCIDVGIPPQEGTKTIRKDQDGNKVFKGKSDVLLTFRNRSAYYDL
jgi:hypothetical protein